MKIYKYINICTFVTSIVLRIQKITHKEKFQCYGIPYVICSKGSKISFGKNVRLRNAPFTNLIGLYQRCNIVAKQGANVVIGDDVGMSGVTLYAVKGINIGKKCLIGANVKIIDNDFHPIDPDVRRERPLDEVCSREINIGENVFVGCNALILKGVTIGDNSVIGAGSVVSKDVPANCIVAGNPARVVKYLTKESE